MDPHQNFMKWSQLAKKFLGDDFWSDVIEHLPATVPKADVYHGDHELLVLVDLPGLENVNQIRLSVEGDALLVKGRMSPRQTHYEPVLQERYTGDFERRIQLGASVNRKNSSARYRKGVLEVRLPRGEVESDSPSIRIRD
ncbi:HSP20 family protein [Melghirimyces profundicolus]|uniref:HSP20 family protein n=1 Tax=Melghirimyces profundicolus TaxID=1242148 RepID=A0A2T6BXA6_9BACL|nr:Hsp20/alpha crystallin family protein [Melghirimyces profundicolus]PTX60709.1 HSP20 family protein [Melghirimyces profundicolus]